MFSCVNQPRGCRGRVNQINTRCDSCRQLGLRKTSIFTAPSPYRRPSIDLPSLASLSNEYEQR
ncbi:hypothetical protein P167DRAFT_510541 [Morchella conica CCBAS932]|uniref:Uncharacterized protein n=1 Tax=Morchella conica CCBAS932 TaxID=1392247 RepID=A0A3N4KJR4_9PEZI|nr:hypothetical protein P167DRAFT_510541 [Morchella conica CCBAS932]